MQKSTESACRVYPAILLHPLVMHGKLYKGVIWTYFPDVLLQNYPDVKKYFIVISTAAWHSWSHSSVEDIHALTVESDIEGFKKEFPNQDYIILHDADFISENDFCPVKTNKEYDLIFVSRTAAFKRHHTLIKIMYILKNKYHRDIKALIIAIREYKVLEIYRIFKPPVTLKNIVLNIKFRFYRPIIMLFYKKAMMDSLNITLITEPKDEGSIKSFYSKSKMYLLLSTYEGVNRTVREAILCNTPIMVIKNCPTAEAYVNNDTGKAVEDDPDIIAQEIIALVDSYESYSPRKWVLENQPRKRTAEIIWGKINSIQRFPGYPDINAANDIRKQFTKNKYDNYSDLNNFKGHYGKSVDFFNLTFFDKTLSKAREDFKRYV